MKWETYRNNSYSFFYSYCSGYHKIKKVSVCVIMACYFVHEGLFFTWMMQDTGSDNCRFDYGSDSMWCT